MGGWIGKCTVSLSSSIESHCRRPRLTFLCRSFALFACTARNPPLIFYLQISRSDAGKGEQLSKGQARKGRDDGCCLVPFRSRCSTLTSRSTVLLCDPCAATKTHCQQHSLARDERRLSLLPFRLVRQVANGRSFSAALCGVGRRPFAVSPNFSRTSWTVPLRRALSLVAPFSSKRARRSRSFTAIKAPPHCAAD